MSETQYRCVYCCADTSFGSGKFVNRVPADADCAVETADGHVIFKEGEYRDGYACAECMMLECCRCGKPIDLNEDVTPYDVTGGCEFDDGTFRVHEDCLTDKESELFNAEINKLTHQ